MSTQRIYYKLQTPGYTQDQDCLKELAQFQKKKFGQMKPRLTPIRRKRKSKKKSMEKEKMDHEPKHITLSVKHGGGDRQCHGRGIYGCQWNWVQMM